MKKPLMIEKTFSRAEMRCSENQITCYTAKGGEGISLAEYVGYVIDTVKGRSRCAEGKCTLEDISIVIRIERITGPAGEPVS